MRRQQENERFESESRQLLSNDDVFLERFNDIEKSRRYVTPEELQSLLDRYLDVLGTGSQLTTSATSGVFRLAGGMKDLRGRLMRALARSPEGARAARAFIARLADEGIELTFDPAVATTRRELEFVSLHHPLIRALAESPDLRAQLSPCGVLELDRGSRALPGLFFVFELQAHGLKDEIEFFGIVIDSQGTVDEETSERLLATLESARTGNSEQAPAGAAVKQAYETAVTRVAAEVETREQGLQERNDETINARIESLTLSIDRRRLRLAEQLQEARAEWIKRMRRSQLSRLESEYEARLAALEEKRGVSVGYRLIAAGVITPPLGG